MTILQPEEAIANARQLLAAGHTAEAASAARTALAGLAPSPATRVLRERAFKVAVSALFLGGTEGRMRRTFFEYAAEFGVQADRAFDAVYLESCLATRTAPLPLRRRNRFKALADCVARAAAHEGLTAECGCLAGLSSLIICRYLQRSLGSFDGAGHRVFDSFRGLSEPTEADTPPADWDGATNFSKHLERGAFAATIEVVRRNLAAFPGIEYYPGWIPSAFPQDEIRYKFVHVDVDLYQPTLDSIAYFHPRLSDGGMLVCDDYDYWPGARRAVDEYALAHGIRLQRTPAGQAVLARDA